MESDESNNTPLPTPPPPPPAANGGAPSAYRWNPTKEQLSMLENMYNQGIRTPTREQIEEMTSRVKEYGPIEGKNVFFWFHNRKAKEKRKQKQDHMAASFNQLMQHTPPPSLPPSPPNVVCSPCNLSSSDLGSYPRCRRLLLPPLVEERGELPEKIQKISHNFAGELSGLDEYRLQIGRSTPNQETLTLFPMHPIGILQEKANSVSNSSQNSVATATTPSSSSDTTTCINEQEAAAAAEHHFFDFFKDH